MRLAASIAHMEELAILPKLAVAIEPVYKSCLAFPPTKSSTPWLFSLEVWAVGGGVVQVLAPGTPALRAHCLTNEALGTDAQIHLHPRLPWVTCSLLSKILIVHNPRGPFVFLACFGDCCLVGHELWDPLGVLLCQDCHIQPKTLQPCHQVLDWTRSAACTTMTCPSRPCGTGLLFPLAAGSFHLQGSLPPAFWPVLAALP